MRTPVSVGVVGLGREGVQLARAFDDSPLAELRWLCDEPFTRRVDDLLEDETLDAVALATPTPTRCALVRRALEADKHVYVEGPLSVRTRDTLELMHLAELKHRRLMIGHALLFHPGVRKLKELIDLGRLGDVYYLTATLTTSQRRPADENVLAAEAGNVVATILHLLGDEPISASSTAESYVQPGELEVASCYLRFATGIAATVQVSWLDARDQCLIAAVGSRRTAVFDAREPSRKVTVFEKGSPRGAEVVSPRVPVDEPLRLQCDAFLGGVRAAVQYPSTRLAPAVVRVLESLGGETSRPVPVGAGRSRLRLAVAEPGT
jgi:predicted dehydrogenase